MKVAIICDWLVYYAGAEKVITEIIKEFPDADLYSVIDFLSDEDRKKINGKHAKTTLLQNMPFVRKNYRLYLPFMPFAIEQLDLHEYDLIISSSYAVAKGVITGPDQLHISYVHSPIRYAWDLQNQYLKEANMYHGLKSLIARRMLKRIRDWDYRTSNGVDYFISNSNFIGRRIWKVYRRHSQTIYPPVNTSYFEYDSTISKGDFYLAASRLVPYKKMDLIVRSFKQMTDKKLVIIGKGPDLEKVRKEAEGATNISILGFQPDAVLREHMQKAKAFIFAAEEDFGIVPVEAQASGTPVIALNKGGTAETVNALGHSDKPTGILFDRQKETDIIAAVKEFEVNEKQFQPTNCVENAQRFSTQNFSKELRNFVDRSINKKWGKKK